jgi:tetratricopeptide (TPR) repeat protein
MSLFISQKRNNLRLVLLFLPFLLYMNTVNNDYALDDSIVITQNSYVKQGISGISEIFSTETFTGFFKKQKDLVEGGRYRPLSLATFAVEYSIFGERPSVSHGINAFLFAIFCLILFEFIGLLFLNFGLADRHMMAAFIAVLIFAAHPIHTEVVANIKGRDELLAGIFCLLSFYCLIKSPDFYTKSKVITSGLLIFVGLLSKENVIMLIPIAFLYVIMLPKTINRKPAYFSLISITIGALLYLILRFSVIGGFGLEEPQELMNNPFLEAHNGEKIPTILYTLFMYLKLLIIPYPLTYDYYPYHISLQSWSSPVVIVSVLIHLILIFAGFYYYKKNHVISFSIFFYVIFLLPVSNLFINIGSFMNERFLFLPSIAFAILCGYYIDKLIKAGKMQPAPKRFFIVLFSAVLLLFSLITVKRNNDWKDNLTLFIHDVTISHESAKGNCAAGGVLYEAALKIDNEQKRMAMLKKSISYLDKSLSVYPVYIDALLLNGNARFELTKDLSQALVYYQRIFSLAPAYELAYKNLNTMLTVSKDPVARKKACNILLKRYPEDFNAIYQLGVTYGKMLNQMDSAVIYLSEAVRLEPKNKLANRDLGVAYAMNGKYSMSLPYLRKVVQISPEDPDNYINLGITYQKLGMQTEANVFFAKAEELKRRNPIN